MARKKSSKGAAAAGGKEKSFYWYSRVALPPFLALMAFALAFFWLENELALLVLLPIAGWWLGWRAVSRFNGGVKNAFVAGVLACIVPLFLNALAFYRILTTPVVAPAEIVCLVDLRLPLLESILFNSLANLAVFLVFVLASAVSLKIARKAVPALKKLK